MAQKTTPNQYILNRLLPALNHIDFSIEIEENSTFKSADFEWEIIRDQANDETIFTGSREGLQVSWVFAPYRQGFWVRLEVESKGHLNYQSITSLAFDFIPVGNVPEYSSPVDYSPTQNLAGIRIPTLGISPFNMGLHRLGALTEAEREGSLLRGAFTDSRTPGIFLGTQLPQKHLHLYSVATAGDAICFRATTQFQKGFLAAKHAISETTWISSNYTLSQALKVYAGHVPLQSNIQPPVGWGSWDYYFFSASLDDVIENMDTIRDDLVLAKSIRYIEIDEAWEHMNGEWRANYKFPGGMQHAAQEISRRGFIPGIWTAPTLVDQWSKTALRDYDMLLTDEYGDPIRSGEHYILDPTHPKAQPFLRELYTGLFQAGFRFFKVDFVDNLLSVPHFHDRSLGPYEVLRRLFALIRECVGTESHIMGCSLPFECGPGVADSMRTGIDIHNQWTHVEWAVDSLQLLTWAHGRLCVNDPDYLVVRGQDTSLESETNVLNPDAHKPNPPRWRRGPVFTEDEARTWATIVSLSGGSVFLSDRLGKLNEAGRNLIAKVAIPTGTAAHPLDLGDAERASLWLADRGDEFRLGVINWENIAVTRSISFSELGLAAPQRVQEFWSEVEFQVQNDAVKVLLPAHGSVIFIWKK